MGITILNTKGLFLWIKWGNVLKISACNGYQEPLEHREYSDGSAEGERPWEKFILSWSWPGLLLWSRYTWHKGIRCQVGWGVLVVPVTPLPFKGEVVEKLIVVMGSVSRGKHRIQTSPEHATHCRQEPLACPLRIWNLGHLQRQPMAWAIFPVAEASTQVQEQSRLNVKTLKWRLHSTSSLKHTKQSRKSWIIAGTCQLMAPRSLRAL